MPSGRFNPFETLLLTSRSQADTAGLMLLAWVMACQAPLDDIRRARLTELARECRHGHDLAPIFALADRQDFDAIQLAAEVMQKDRGGEQAYPFLRQAIALCAAKAEPSIAQHHVLRFLADLLGVPPASFATLYAEQAGRPYAVPEDPSRRDYWLAQEHHRQQEAARQREQEAARQREQDERRREQEARERQEQEARRREQEARERERQQQERTRQEKARERERQQQERTRQEKARQEKARQNRAREERARQERTHQENARQERQRQGGGSSGEDRRRAQPPSRDARTQRALAVLGLPPGASRHEIRKAYRRLAQTHHPDRFFAEGEARMATASQRFQRIKNAYDYLTRAS